MFTYTPTHPNRNSYNLQFQWSKTLWISILYNNWIIKTVLAHLTNWRVIKENFALSLAQLSPSLYSSHSGSQYIRCKTSPYFFETPCIFIEYFDNMQAMFQTIIEQYVENNQDNIWKMYSQYFHNIFTLLLILSNCCPNNF